MLKWPDPETVREAATAWGSELVRREDDVRRVGIFGSYARAEQGVGSDLDLVVILDESELPPIERALRFDATRLPVPADVLVYTEQEWQTLDSPFLRRLREETRWVT